MGFTTGQVVRVNEDAQVVQYAQGRLAVVDEVVRTPEGTKYIVSLFSWRMPVKEAELRIGPDETVH